ncbi:hypothetical protein AB0M54_42155 [Actinoplanes sp. NPDC051470]|uniref:hypothetical protein n=1 Tax=unclassified Actinoplanes TaxID=2626549 RepID=UPI00342BBEEA
MRRALLTVAVVAGVVLLPAPAFAHGGDTPDATSFRTEVTGLAPAVPGLVVTAIEAGARLELTNDTGRTVEVLGYSGEPYLEVRPDGTYENVHSPATYLNQTLAGETPLPAAADPAAPPQWRRVSGDLTVRWHDQRTHWTGDGLPPAATAEPYRGHHLRDWVVPLRQETTELRIQGTLDYLPPPPEWLWWAGAVAIMLAVAAAGRWSVAAGPVAGAALLAYAILRTLDAPAPTVTYAAGLIGLASAFLTRSAFLTTLAGAVVAVFGGLIDLGVLQQAVVPVAGPAWIARTAVTLAIGGGLGLVVQGMMRLRHQPGATAKVAG